MGGKKSDGLQTTLIEVLDLILNYFKMRVHSFLKVKNFEFIKINFFKKSVIFKLPT